MWLVSQVFALIAGILYFVAMKQTSTKKYLIVDTIHVSFLIIANILLGGIVGAVVQLIVILRAMLKYHNKLNKATTIGIILLQIILGLICNREGVIGILPILASIQFSFALLFSNHTQTIKKQLLINLAIWLLYDIALKNVIGSFSDILYFVFTLYGLYQESNQSSTNDVSP